MSSYIDPTREAFGQFADLKVDGPVQMLNLIRLRPTAKYEDGREASGAEAYRIYAKAAEEFFTKNGGTIVWRGVPKFPVIGPSEEAWDLGFIAQYPSKEHFLAMVRDEGYQAIVFHRQAAVADSRLHCFSLAESEGVFG